MQMKEAFFFVTGLLFPESVDLEDFSSVDIMFVWRASENRKFVSSNPKQVSFLHFHKHNDR